MTEGNDANYTKNLLTNEDVNLKNLDLGQQLPLVKSHAPEKSPLKIALIVLSLLSTGLAIALIVSLTTGTDNKCCNSDSNSFEDNLINVSTKFTKAMTSFSNRDRASNMFSKIEGNSLWNHSRLPANFKPSLYTIDLRIDVTNKEFYGNCTIVMTCNKESSMLVVHSEENIVFSKTTPFPTIHELDADLNVIANLEVAKLEVNRFYTYAILVLQKGQMFKENCTYSVYFENYYSTITNNLKGIYYSTYAMKSGEQRPLVVSQLQPLDARTVFPGFDEPDLKAKFAISITHEKGKINVLEWKYPFY